MCGAFILNENAALAKLVESLNIPVPSARGILLPTQPIHVVRDDKQGDRCLLEARWWLLLGKDGKPDQRYATFNSRSTKLYTSPLTKGLYTHSRCIIPATGFIEGQDGHYHMLERPDQGIAFGGLLREIEIDGKTHRSASIITCPGNAQLDTIHRKSIPLLLPVENTELIDDWLSPALTDTQRFDHLLDGSLHHALDAYPIQGARDLTVSGKYKRLQAGA